jgi:hypothetical protein
MFERRLFDGLFAVQPLRCGEIQLGKLVLIGSSLLCHHVFGIIDAFLFALPQNGIPSGFELGRCSPQFPVQKWTDYVSINKKVTPIKDCFPLSIHFG